MSSQTSTGGSSRPHACELAADPRSMVSPNPPSETPASERRPRPSTAAEIGAWLSHRRHMVTDALVASAGDRTRFPRFSSLASVALREVMDLEWRSLLAFLSGDRATHDALWEQHQPLQRWLFSRVPLDEQLAQLTTRGDTLRLLVESDPATAGFRDAFLQRLDSRIRYARVALNARFFQLRYASADAPAE